MNYPHHTTTVGCAHDLDTQGNAHCFDYISHILVRFALCRRPRKVVLAMNERVYTIRKPCGCLVAAAVVTPDRAGKQMSREVSKWIADGENVQQETIKEVRASCFSCEVCKPVTPQQELFL